MAKLTKKEILDKAKTIIGDRTDDDALGFLEDINDTISEGGEDDWKAKYDAEVEAKKQLDQEWRTKYKERFFSADSSQLDKDKTNPANVDKDKPSEDDEDAKLEQANKVTFDDLFKEKEN